MCPQRVRIGHGGIATGKDPLLSVHLDNAAFRDAMHLSALLLRLRTSSIDKCVAFATQVT